jgi:hypothetical protein
MMPSLVEKEDRRRKKHEPIQSQEAAASRKEPAQSQPLPPRDDIQARIADRAYEIYAQRGYREGYALDDWLEAEREIRSRT